jgi:cell wall-associated NlpC family hydrolase
MRVHLLRQLHIACVVVTAFAVTPIATPLATAAPAGHVTMRQQVQELEAQVSALEERYDGLQERYRGAKVEQRKLERASRDAAGKLARAREKLAVARERLMNRVVALYQDSSSSPLVDLAAAGSITEAFDRVEAANRIGKSDAEYVNSVIKLERRVAKHERAVRSARDSHARVTRRMARDARQMQRLLAQRRAALASATAEVRRQMERDRQAAATRSATASRERIAQLQGGETSAAPDSGDPAPSSPTATHAENSPASSSASGDASGPAVSVPLPPSSGAAAHAAQIAMGKVGAPYVWAAAGPDSFDCSGLVVWAFAQAGRPGLPHSTYSLITMGVEVPLAQAQVGDLVFTNSTGHMGIYVGGGQMVHSPRTGRTVSVEPLTYYSVTAIRRI